MVPTMRRPTREDFTIVDATGERYPPGRLIWKTIDTIGRTLVVLALLAAVGLGWEFFH